MSRKLLTAALEDTTANTSLNFRLPPIVTHENNTILEGLNRISHRVGLKHGPQGQDEGRVQCPCGAYTCFGWKFGS